MVEPIYRIEKVTQVYEQDKYQSVENKVTEHRTFISRVPEIGVISFGAIEKNKFREISLEDKGIVSSVMLASVYAFSGDTLTDEITFNIYHRLDNGTKVRVATEKFRSNEMPYQFPHGAILTPKNIIEIKPSANLDNIFVYVKPVIEMFRVSAD